MDEFDGAGGMHGWGGVRLNIGFKDSGGFEAKNGANAFAAREDAVAHGGVNRHRLRGLSGKQTDEGGVNGQAILFKKIGEVHREGTRTSGGLLDLKIRSRFRVRMARASVFRQPSSEESQRGLRLLPTVSGTREKAPRPLQKAAWRRRARVAGSQGGEPLLPVARGNARNQVSWGPLVFLEQENSRVSLVFRMEEIS